MTLRGSAKTAAGASVSGKLHDAPAAPIENDFADASQPLETNEVTSASEVEREAAGSHRGQGVKPRAPLSPPLSAPSLAAAIQNVADAYYEVEHATTRMEFFAKVLLWWDAREALREFLTGDA